MSAESPCPGCGLILPPEDGPRHPYMLSSAACWARFGEMLAVEFSDPAWFGAHQVTVDAYAVQHPGRPERRSIQSVALHLMTLGMMCERKLDPADAPRLHKRMAHRPEFTWLEPPPMAGRLTVSDVLGAGIPREHERRVMAWGLDLWEARSPHHATVWEWLEMSLGSASG